MTNTYSNLTSIVDKLQANNKQVKVIKLKSQFTNKRQKSLL